MSFPNPTAFPPSAGAVLLHRARVPRGTDVSQSVTPQIRELPPPMAHLHGQVMEPKRSLLHRAEPQARLPPELSIASSRGCAGAGHLQALPGRPSASPAAFGGQALSNHQAFICAGPIPCLQ